MIMKHTSLKRPFHHITKKTTMSRAARKSTTTTVLLPVLCLFLICFLQANYWISVESYQTNVPFQYTITIGMQKRNINPSKHTAHPKIISRTTTSNLLLRRSGVDDVSTHDDENLHLSESTISPGTISRRQVLLTTASTATTAAVMLFGSQNNNNIAKASVAEIDKTTGSLYTPKSEMLKGGSVAARGVELQTKSTDTAITRKKPGQQIQNVYETRFITYLSRFLLNFDDVANAWWIQNTKLDENENNESSGNTMMDPNRKQQELIQFKFAEFSESVEIGLADYFVGPYGSYSSLSAMKAGITAKSQAKSRRYDDDGTKKDKNIFQKLFFKQKEKFFSILDKEEEKRKIADRDRISKQGVLNLYTLLKARYTSRTAKRQLAILFSFFSNPNIQPTAEIRSLLGEVDNATITKIDFIKPRSESEITSRTSSRRGGGYSVSEPPKVDIEAPPALGAAYKCAKVKPIMKPTSRVLRINVLDGGQGYSSPPEVYVASIGSIQPCTACSILDREGHVESILVLDPGYGYGRRKAVPPVVTIAPPKYRGIVRKKNLRPSIAKAELEYEVVGIDIVEGGNGYVATEPPKVTISPPEEDPDWFVDVPELAALETEFGPMRVEVAEMLGPKGNLAYSLGGMMTERTNLTPPQPIKLPLANLREDPTELLPSAVRPQLNSYGTYVIPSIAAVRTFDNIMDNPRFRAVDPLFGAIGTLPAQKSANELKPSEYARLALSGAVCTVLVRTALNPLELIKTKQQLENDKELLTFARQSVGNVHSKSSTSNPSSIKPKFDDPQPVDDEPAVEGGNVAAIATKPVLTAEPTEDDTQGEVTGKIGSKDMIVSLVKLRGPAAAFQSADITFLASLVFGSLGFGATELFRRSFTMAFFMGEESDQFNTEIVLLLAATVATILTSAAAAPFELLRVRSMGLVEPKPWTEIMKDFLKEKSSKKLNGSSLPEFEFKDLQLDDYKPLWQGFGPTASRELAFAIPKFLAFDIIARGITGFINSQLGPGALPIQVGVGGEGLAISAFAGAIAGIAGAFVSHPADLILTKLSASQKSNDTDDATDLDWKDIVKELLSKEGGFANLFVGLTPRLIFFFLVIGLQFFLYDYVKNLLQVGSDDLSLVLDVFYAVRQGLIDGGNGSN